MKGITKMKVYEIAKNMGLKVYTAESAAHNREVDGCYIGDLLSLAMAKAEQNNVWITIQTNVNIVAVAGLTDVSCIIIADGFVPDKMAIEKAEEQEIIILGGDSSAYDTAVQLAELGI